MRTASCLFFEDLAIRLLRVWSLVTQTASSAVGYFARSAVMAKAREACRLRGV